MTVVCRVGVTCFLAAEAFGIAACSSPAGPAGPTPTPAPLAGGATAGRVVDALSPGTGVGTAVLSGPLLQPSATDSTGRFRVATDVGGTLRLTIDAPGFVERRSQIRVPGPEVVLSLIPSRFNLAAFDQMCRANSGGRLGRWSSQPQLVVQRRLVDWTNKDASGYLVLDEQLSDQDVNCMVERVSRAVGVMSAGHLAVTSITVEGAKPGSRVRLEGADGELQIWGAKNLDAAGVASFSFWQDYAARRAFAAFIAGRTTGPNTYQTRCDAMEQLYQHEMGHCLGYQHVAVRSVMAVPPLYSEMTDFDRQAIALVYQRPPGNATPDDDPASFTANQADRTSVWLVEE